MWSENDVAVMWYCGCGRGGNCIMWIRHRLTGMRSWWNWRSWRPIAKHRGTTCERSWNTTWHRAWRASMNLRDFSIWLTQLVREAARFMTDTVIGGMRGGMMGNGKMFMLIEFFCKLFWKQWKVTQHDVLVSCPSYYIVGWYLSVGYRNGDQFCPVGPLAHCGVTFVVMRMLVQG